MQRLLSKLTYANVVSTIALCVAVGGGAAFAAGKIDSSQIATGGVHTKNLQHRSVTSGKLALGAVRSNQIAPGAVDTGELATGAVHPGQIATGAVGSRQLSAGAVGADQIAKGAVGGDQLAKGAVDSAALGAGAVTPAQMRFPVALVGTPSGGTGTVMTGLTPTPYALADASWAPHAEGIDLVVGTITAAPAPVAMVNDCRIAVEFAIDGEFGPEFDPSVELANTSHTEAVSRTKTLDPVTVAVDRSQPTELTAQAREVGSCEGPSTIESMHLRVIEVG